VQVPTAPYYTQFICQVGFSSLGSPRTFSGELYDTLELS
jgi:hypothetical protein